MKISKIIIVVLMFLSITGCKKDSNLEAHEKKDESLYVTVNCELKANHLIDSIVLKTSQNEVVDVKFDRDKMSQSIEIPQAYAEDVDSYYVEMIDTFEATYKKSFNTDGTTGHIVITITPEDIVFQTEQGKRDEKLDDLKH